jgi:5-deoxy-D-glucuronate isomerase
MSAAAQTDYQKSENADAVLGYNDNSSYVYFDTENVQLIGPDTTDFILRDKSQKQLKYHAVIEFTKDAGTIDADTDSVLVVEIYDKVEYGASYTQRKVDTVTNDTDTYRVALEADNFNILEFEKLRIRNTYEAVEISVDKVFIKSVEE